MTELELQKWQESLIQQNQILNNSISSIKDLEINEKNFIKEFLNLIINQGNRSNYQDLSKRYSDAITEKRLNQLKNIASKKIYTEFTEILAKRLRQQIGI